MRSISPFVLVMLLAGCGARREYRASELELERLSWDSLRVHVDFARRQVIGGAKEVTADRILVAIFNQQYDTLYAGGPGLIRLDDAALGDRERLTLEACGEVKSREICVQETLEASPKRVSVEDEIEFPAGDDFAAGTYDFTFRAERQRFVGSGWERIPATNVTGHLTAWVDGPESEEEGKVTARFERSRGRFDFSRHPNYRHFKYYLESALLDRETVSVHFEIHGGIGANSSLLTSLVKEIHKKTEEERSDEVRYFVQQGMEKIIDELGSILGARRAVAFVDEWSYDRASRSYRIEMDAEWEGPMFDRGHFEIGGVLQVEEDGSGAVFTIHSANRRAERRWRDRTERRSLSLGDLDPPRDR